MVFYSPDLTNTGFSFLCLTVNPFRQPTLIEQGLLGGKVMNHDMKCDSIRNEFDCWIVH